MTEQTEAATAEVEDTPESHQEIEFRGRKMWVRLPRPEQILVWRRVLNQLQTVDESWNGAQVLQALERTRKIIDSTLVHATDKDWLDDEMLDGTLTLIDAARLITMTLEAFAEDDNREARRAGGKSPKPAKKAARRRA